MRVRVFTRALPMGKILYPYPYCGQNFIPIPSPVGSGTCGYLHPYVKLPSLVDDLLLTWLFDLVGLSRRLPLSHLPAYLA